MSPRHQARIAVFMTALLAMSSASPYTISQTYSGQSLLDGFSFFTAPDPSGGWVTCVDEAAALNNKYVVVSSGVVYIGVDTTSVLSPSGPGRQAVRLVSNNVFNHGLIVGDFAHMPGGICGTWPAFWMVGPNWPAGGEIDIVEGVNTNTYNTMTGHTSSNCTINPQNIWATLLRNDCNAGDSAADPDLGCSMQGINSSSFGTNFNAIGGGVWAVEWTSSWISIWFFQRGNVPANLNSASPDPSTWVKPSAMIPNVNCNIDEHFYDMNIVLNTDFAGGWADSTWTSSGCSAHADSAVDFVARNPAAMSNDYWAVNSIKTYVLQNPAQALNEQFIAPPSSTTTVMPLASISPAVVGLAGLALGGFHSTVMVNGSVTVTAVSTAATTPLPTASMINATSSI